MYIKYDKSTLYLPSVRSNFSNLLNVTSIIRIYLIIHLLLLMINYGYVMFKIYRGAKKTTQIFVTRSISSFMN